jgi:hypothetical protein
MLYIVNMVSTSDVMKISRFLLAGVAISLSTCIVFAGDESRPSASAANATATDAVGAASDAANPTKLPYGVEDVLKLSRAQISDDIVLNYIRSSGTIYNLAPNDIVYLRNQGVSDRVLNAMLDQRKRLTEAAAAATPQPTAPTLAPISPMSPEAAAGNVSAVEPGYAEPGPSYVEPAPVSTVYVIPHAPAAYNFYAGYAPYWGYYGYSYPSFGGYYRACFRPAVCYGARFGVAGHIGQPAHWQGGHFAHH